MGFEDGRGSKVNRGKQQVLVPVSTYQGSILVPVFEPQPGMRVHFLCSISFDLISPFQGSLHVDSKMFCAWLGTS